MGYLNNLFEYTLMFFIRERSAVFLLISQNDGAIPRERLVFKRWLPVSLAVYLAVRSITGRFLCSTKHHLPKEGHLHVSQILISLVPCFSRLIWLISAVCEVKLTDRNNLKIFSVVFISVISQKTAIFFSKTWLYSIWDTPIPLYTEF